LCSHETLHDLLLVDDDPVVRKIATFVFSANGFTVTSASTSIEAIHLMANKKFHVLVSDLNMDWEHEGLSIVEAMQRTQPSALTFILTATPDAKSVLWALRHGVHGYFRKSSDLHAVARQVRDHVSCRRQSSLEAA